MAALLIVFISCANRQDAVINMVNHRNSFNNMQVSVEGILETRNGFFNIFSRDRQLCIGLLVYNRDIPRYSALVRRRVVATGRLQAEGCGREGVCTEYLCGPAILRDVSIEPAPG